MNDENNSQQPWFFGVFGVLAIGLATFFVWLLRLISKPVQGLTPIPSSEKQVRDEVDVDNPSAERLTVADSPSAEGMDGHLTSTKETASQPEAISQAQLVSPNTTINESNPWTAPTRYIAGTGVFIFFLWLINYSQQTLSLLVFAALIAILAQPVNNFFQKRLRFSRGLAITITYLLVASLIVIVPILIIPNIAQGINSLLGFDWQSLVDSIAETLNQMATSISTIPLIGTGIANSFGGLAELAQGLVTSKPEPVSTDPSAALNQLGETVGFLGNLVGPLVSGIISMIFMLLISLQISLSGDQIRGWIINPVPQRFKIEINNLLDRIMLVWVSFLHGEFTLMIVMGLLTWLLNILLGTPQAALLGLLAGLLEVVPSLGPIIATVPAAFLALIFGSAVFPGLNPWIFMVIVILGYTLLQLVENQVLVPKILGNAVSLPPLIVLVGVTIAGTKAGIVGIFLATPLMATGKVLLEYVNKKIHQEPEVNPPPDEDKSTFMDQMRGFMGRIQLSFRRAGQGDAGKASEIIDETA